MTTCLIVALSLQVFAQAAPAAPAAPAAAAPVVKSVIPPGGTPPKPDVPEERCGSTRPKLDAIKTAEGLVIAPDGTIYFTQPFGTGSSELPGPLPAALHRRPSCSWVDLGGKALGITIDPKRAHALRRVPRSQEAAGDLPVQPARW